MPQRIKVETSLLLIPSVFLLLAFSLPVFLIAIEFSQHKGDVAGILTSGYNHRLFGFTASQAAWSMVFSVLFGLPGAWLLGRCSFRGKSLLKAVSTIPFVMPSILVVLQFVLVFGNAGLINNIRHYLLDAMGQEYRPWRILYSYKAIIMAHVFFNFPLTLRIVGDAWARLPALPNRAARSLGAGRIQTFFFIELPRLYPAILTAAIITFLYCFTSFAIILVLGGGPQFTTVEVEIYRLVKQQHDFARAGALAAMQSVLILGILTAYALMENRLGKHTSDDTQDIMACRPMPLHELGLYRILVFIWFILTILLVFTPMIALAVNSFIGRSTRTAALALTLNHWKRIFGHAEGGAALKALFNTMVLSAAAATISTLNACIMAWYASRHPSWKKILESTAALPLGLSSIIMGLGWLLLLQRIPDRDFFRILALIASHGLITLPFCFRIIQRRFKQISVRIPHAAQACGANSFQNLIHIELPLCKRALVTSAVFAFAVSAGELNTVMILAPGNFGTLSRLIYRLIAVYDFNAASALGSILMIFCGLAFFMLDRLNEI